jgi:hypothetical protein
MNGQLVTREKSGFRVPTLLESTLQNGKLNYVACSYQHSVFYHSDKGMNT